MSILARQAAGPETNAHDGVVQVEAAIQFLLAGQNPYAVNYDKTALANWNWGHPYPNPALYYLAYLPFMFLVGIPLQLLAEATLGWYDQRFVYLLALATAMFSWGRLARDRVSLLAALAVVALSPLAAPYFIEGRNDILVLALLGLSLQALHQTDWGSRYAVSGALFGVACATKQSVWFLGPFCLLYIWNTSGRNLARLLRCWLVPGAATAGVLILPFFLWSPANFVEDTFSYLSGNVAHNYPIKTNYAYGLHVLLASEGFADTLRWISSGPFSFLRPATEALTIRSELQSYPFWIFQLLFAVPVFVLALRQQARHNSISTALGGYAVTLLTYQYFSRFLHDNYIGFVLTVWLLAFLVREPPPALAEESAATSTSSRVRAQ